MLGTVARYAVFAHLPQIADHRFPTPRVSQRQFRHALQLIDAITGHFGHPQVRRQDFPVRVQNHHSHGGMTQCNLRLLFVVARMPSRGSPALPPGPCGERASSRASRRSLKARAPVTIRRQRAANAKHKAPAKPAASACRHVAPEPMIPPPITSLARVVAPSHDGFANAGPVHAAATMANATNRGIPRSSCQERFCFSTFGLSAKQRTRFRGILLQGNPDEQVAIGSRR